MNEYVRRYLIGTDNWKDKVQYTVAATSFVSGVAMGFVSFLTQGTISGEILGFIGECFTLTGGIFGITLYIRNKVSSAEAYIMNSMNTIMHNKDYSDRRDILNNEHDDNIDVVERPQERAN